MGKSGASGSAAGGKASGGNRAPRKAACIWHDDVVNKLIRLYGYYARKYDKQMGKKAEMFKKICDKLNGAVANDEKLQGKASRAYTTEEVKNKINNLRKDARDTWTKALLQIKETTGKSGSGVEVDDFRSEVGTDKIITWRFAEAWLECFLEHSTLGPQYAMTGVDTADPRVTCRHAAGAAGSDDDEAPTGSDSSIPASGEVNSPSKAAGTAVDRHQCKRRRLCPIYDNDDDHLLPDTGGEGGCNGVGDMCHGSGEADKYSDDSCNSSSSGESSSSSDIKSSSSGSSGGSSGGSSAKRRVKKGKGSAPPSTGRRDVRKKPATPSSMQQGAFPRNAPYGTQFLLNGLQHISREELKRRMKHERQERKRQQEFAMNMEVQRQKFAMDMEKERQKAATLFQQQMQQLILHTQHQQAAGSPVGAPISLSHPPPGQMPGMPDA